MSLYSIEDTTLTALGDAVRSKAGKYISVEEKGEPFYTGEFIPTEMDFEKEVYSQSYFTKTINLKELLGDRYEYTKYLYFESEYTAESARVVRFIDLQKDASTSLAGLITDETPYATENKSGFISYSTPVDNPFIRIVMYSYNLNKPVKLKLKLWACDVNKQYLGLNKYTPLEMVDKINELMTIPDEALSIAGDCSYRFAYGGSDWLINRYGDKITTKNITTASYMFVGSTRLEEIPFVINLNNNAPIDYMFQNCNKLKNIPQVNVTRTSHTAYSYIFANCYNIRELPDWFIDLLEQDYNISSSNSTFAPWRNMLTNCYSLRKIPDRAMKAMVNPKPSGNYYTVAYSNPFSGCRSLDELVNIYPDNFAFTSNQFSSFIDSLYRIKDFTFATNDDGTPMVRKWKNQTLNFASGWNGWVNGSASNVTGYNSGITADKQVTDDATYQALKDDPDWFSCIAKYSRYNHDSAVNTINSLPDCSATGTNVIKFLRDVGAGTDGGAIGNLTEEEIAVATAKGWTVSLV